MGKLPNPAGLTARQLEVLQLHAVDGLKQPAIGRLLYLSPYTVKDHLEGAEERIVAWAGQNGIDLQGDPLLVYQWRFVEPAKTGGVETEGTPRAVAGRLSDQASHLDPLTGIDYLSVVPKLVARLNPAGPPLGALETTQPSIRGNIPTDETLISLLRRSDVVARKVLAVLFGRHAPAFYRAAAGFQNPSKLIEMTFVAVAEDCDQFDPFEDDARQWIGGKLANVLREHGEPTDISSRIDGQAIPDQLSVMVLTKALEALSEAERAAVSALDSEDHAAVDRYCQLVGKAFLQMVGDEAKGGSGK